MIILSNKEQQTIPVGGAVTFDNRIYQNGCSACNRNGRNSVKMTQKGTYEASYAANIGGATAGTAVQLSLQLGGETLPETTAISVPAAANDLNNVSRSTIVRNWCPDYSRFTLVNTGTDPVIVGANSVLILKRICG